LIALLTFSFHAIFVGNKVDYSDYKKSPAVFINRSNSVGVSKQRCELTAWIDLSQLLPLANPSHRRLSDVNDGMRISLPMIFSKGLFG
jgi:hypothetical protein